MSPAKHHTYRYELAKRTGKPHIWYDGLCFRAVTYWPNFGFCSRSGHTELAAYRNTEEAMIAIRLENQQAPPA